MLEGEDLVTLIDQSPTPTVSAPQAGSDDEQPELQRLGDGLDAQQPEAAEVSSTVTVRRRTVDTVLIAAGIVVTAVLIAAGALLTWGSNFADDYVHDELSAQNIQFPDAATLEEDNPALLGYADAVVDTGGEAEAYATYIDGHLAATADGATYADLGGPEREARTALEAAQDEGADEATIAELQAAYDEVSGQRNSLFKGETLRGLLLSTFAWSTIGRIAGIAAIAAFVAGGLMLVLVLLGVWHRGRTAPSAVR